MDIVNRMKEVPGKPFGPEGSRGRQRPAPVYMSSNIPIE